MNYRNAEKSAQLKHILELLVGRGTTGATTLELSNASGSLNVATCISELRHGGYNITCAQERATGTARVYRYVIREAVYNK